MILFTDLVFLTDEKEGFRICRETRTTSAKTMTVLFCKAGYIDVHYHGEMIRINKNDLFVRIPDFKRPLGPYQMSDDFEFAQITVDVSVYEQIMYERMRNEPEWFDKQEYIINHPIFPLDERSIDFFNSYFHLMSLQLSGHMTDYRKQILKLMANGAMMELLNYMDKLALIAGRQQSRTATNHSDYMFHEFMRLLQQYPHAREVQWYAKQMNITPKYLSEITKDRSGKSAGEWIAEVTVSELKHYLRNTTLPIHEVARMMEFPNASFFCQYTKKHLGKSPNQVRKQKDI